jgi:hypothetical protein
MLVHSPDLLIFRSVSQWLPVTFMSPQTHRSNPAERQSSKDRHQAKTTSSVLGVHGMSMHDGSGMPPIGKLFLPTSKRDTVHQVALCTTQVQLDF